MVKAANCPGPVWVGGALFRVRVSKAEVSQVLNLPWRLVRGSPLLCSRAVGMLAMARLFNAETRT